MEKNQESKQCCNCSCCKCIKPKSDIRCPNGHLLAKRGETHFEIKCGSCKHIVEVPVLAE